MSLRLCHAISHYFCSAMSVVYVADNLLDEADDGTPDGRIPNSHGGSHKRVAVRAGEKVGDVSRRRSLGALNRSSSCDQSMVCEFPVYCNSGNRNAA